MKKHDSIKKAVVAHAGSRDHYQLSLALEEAGYLDKLISDFYSSRLLNLIHPAFRKRYCVGLPTRKVKKSLRVIFIQLLQKIVKEKKEVNDRKQDNALSTQALSRAIKKDLNLFIYSCTAGEAFKKYDGEGKKILFQIHPHPTTVKRILSEELTRVPQAVQSLMSEAEMALPEELLRPLIEEPRLADEIVVASSFTKKSLIENGIDEKIIKVIPYGVDSKIFNNIDKQKKSNQILNVIFVGNIIQRKGVYDLMESMKLLNSSKVHLSLCGRSLDEGLVNAYKNLSNVSIKRNLSRHEIVNELKNSDVFVFPSLVEGFGLVILEAMACGLPVITTENTCGPDVITEGVHGHIIPIRSPEKIAGSIESLINNKNTFEMGIAARKKAEEMNWNLFRSQIATHYHTLNS